MKIVKPINVPRPPSHYSSDTYFSVSIARGFIKFLLQLQIQGKKKDITTLLKATNFLFGGINGEEKQENNYVM